MIDKTELFTGDGLLTDAKVAEQLGKHVKSIKRWDRDPRMIALGWPVPLVINGRNHRPRPKLREFLRKAAAATLNSRAPP
jgi:hypothetical protein